RAASSVGHPDHHRDEQLSDWYGGSAGRSVGNPTGRRAAAFLRGLGYLYRLCCDHGRRDLAAVVVGVGKKFFPGFLFPQADGECGASAAVWLGQFTSPYSLSVPLVCSRSSVLLPLLRSAGSRAGTSAFHFVSCESGAMAGTSVLARAAGRACTRP